MYLLFLALLAGCSDKGADTAGDVTEITETDETTDTGTPGTVTDDTAPPTDDTAATDTAVTDTGSTDTETTDIVDTDTGGTETGDTGDTGRTGPVDNDGDGFSVDEDCDDNNAAINPDAEEYCDLLDNNCDGTIDEATSIDADTWYLDADADGFGDDLSAVTACTRPEGYSASGGDCEDTDAAYNPGALEEDCTDPNDYNCDGSTGYADDDGDGWAACAECDDTDAAVNPDAIELCDEVDNDCDGTIDGTDALDVTTWYADTDNDGFGDFDSPTSACEAPIRHVINPEDCDDTDNSINPAAPEICNDTDDDCDASIDEAATDLLTFYADTDGDSQGDPDSSLDACEVPDGYVLNADDCDDTDGDLTTLDEDGDGVTSCDGDCDDFESTISPDADEICDDFDNDCDEVIDEDAIDATTYYTDADDDDWGDPDSPVTTCELTDDLAENSGDCDDSDYALNGEDFDDDGYTTCDPIPDCDDDRSDTYPGADEYCDDIDHDCDGTIDEDPVDAFTFYADADADGYADPGITAEACIDPPEGFTELNTGDPVDCDDTDGETYPDAVEYCNETDNDCDGTIDEDPMDAPGWFADADGDGEADEFDYLEACTRPDGYLSAIDALIDCDDTDAALNSADADGDGFSTCNDDCDDDPATGAEVYPGSPEVCDEVDNDCDGNIDNDAMDAIFYSRDADADGYGDSTNDLYACEQPDGYVHVTLDDYDCDDEDAALNLDDLDGDGWTTCDEDCDDNEAAVNPNEQELCDELDNDCDEVIDEDADDALDWYEDLDEDGYGDSYTQIDTCDPPPGYINEGTDCDDTDPAINPGAEEIDCNGIDDDCDYVADDLLGDSEACAADDCRTILAARPDVGDGSYYVDSGGGAVELACDMTRDGGGWTQLHDTYRSGLSTSDTREYLYSDGTGWYVSPATTQVWSWSSYQSLNGTYYYATSGDTLTGSFSCTHAESGDFGVGCSNGPGGTYKVLPIYSINSSTEGTCMICQDQPDVFGTGTCKSNIQIWERAL